MPLWFVLAACIIMLILSGIFDRYMNTAKTKIISCSVLLLMMLMGIHEKIYIFGLSLDYGGFLIPLLFSFALMLRSSKYRSRVMMKGICLGILTISS